MEWWQGFTVEVNFLPARTPGMPPHPAEVLSSAGTSTRVPLLGKLLSSALWELRADPFLNEGWEWRCVNSTCQGKPLTRPEWVSKRNFQALNSFPALTRALFISAPPLYSFCHLTQSFHWLLCGCLEGWSLCGGEEFRDFFLFVCGFKKKIPWGPCSPCSFGNGGRPPRLSHSEGIVTKGMRLSASGSVCPAFYLQVTCILLLSGVFFFYLLFRAKILPSVYP